MYCKNCGQKIDDDDLFCGNCGTKIVRKSETAAYVPKQTQNIQQNIEQPWNTQQNIEQPWNTQQNIEQPRNTQQNINRTKEAVDDINYDYTKLPTEKPSGIKSFYFMDFLIRLGNKENIPLCIYLVLNVLLIGAFVTAVCALPVGWGMAAALLLYIA